jgi:dipeptidyl-peptidase-3
MDSVAIEQYKADSPPTVVRLEIKPHFDALTEQQKRYAHHISRSVSSLGISIMGALKFVRLM